MFYYFLFGLVFILGQDGAVFLIQFHKKNMSFGKLYKFLLAFFAFSAIVCISGANARRYDKRWIQSTGFGGAQPETKREIENSVEGKSGGFQGDNGIFPKYSEDDGDEFEKEVEQQGQEPDKDKLDQLPTGQESSESLNPDVPGSEQESVSGGQSQESKGQESGGQEVGGQESARSETVDSEQRDGKKLGGIDEQVSDQEYIDATKSHYKPWYKKVHGFFKNQYDYLKQRIGRGDDYYVNP